MARTGNKIIGSAFRIDRKLGSLGIGTTYRATQLDLDRQVLLKTIPPAQFGGADSLKSIQDKVISGLSIDHPNIARLIALDFSPPTPYMVFEHFEGQSLKSLMSSLKRRPSLSELLEYLAQAADALACAHAEGRVHGTVNPDIIIVNSDGTVQLLDFGIGLFGGVPQIRTSQGIFRGIPEYAAPEVIEGSQPGPAADIYAFGATCFELISARPPVEGKDELDLLNKHLAEVPPPLTDLNQEIPESLAHIVWDCLEKSPDCRPQNAAVVAEGFRGVLAGMEAENIEIMLPRARQKTQRRSSRAIAGPPPAAAPPVSRNLRRFIITAALLVPLLLIGLYFSTPAPAPEMIRDVHVLQCGAKAVMVEWEAQWRAGSVPIVLKKTDTEEDPVEVLIRPMSVPGTADKPPFRYTALVNALSPKTAYELVIKNPDGSSSLPRRFRTCSAVPFKPVRKIEPTPDGKLKITVENKTTMTVSFSPRPDKLSPVGASGRPVYSGKHQAVFTLDKLADDPLIRIGMRTLDGEKDEFRLDVRKYFMDIFKTAAESYEAERLNDKFFDIFNIDGLPLGKFLRHAGRNYKSLSAKDPDKAKKLTLAFWRKTNSILSKKGWYPGMSALMPGLSALGRSRLADTKMKQLLSRALMPFKLVDRALRWYEVPVNPDWRDAVSPLKTPHPIGFGTPFIPGAEAKRECRSLQLVKMPFYLIFDARHPKFGAIFTNPLLKDLFAGPELTTKIAAKDLSILRGAEIELSVRTASLPIIILVDINEGAFIAHFEDRYEDIERFDAWRRETGANVREVAMMVKGEFGKKDKLQDTIKVIDKGLPEKPRRLYMELPLSCLRAGRNRFSLYAISSPVDSFEYVAVTSLVLRLTAKR